MILEYLADCSASAFTQTKTVFTWTNRHHSNWLQKKKYCSNTWHNSQQGHLPHRSQKSYKFIWFHYHEKHVFLLSLTCHNILRKYNCDHKEQHLGIPMKMWITKFLVQVLHTRAERRKPIYNRSPLTAYTKVIDQSWRNRNMSALKNQIESGHVS